ncbi:hypothetical protein PV08_05099 [Exophiala spinifera]|uniref:Beta-lactamase-related domain-containing protein n=1 Tax=Exophiala spinifera TaxID=91928 RepID=A0A0D2C2Q9_9EURO|nr:uncharacterized protein PV08_05099 [Exophiala spinifera]KIW17904.1 hypothetical protein PV08_05099 [Exophiala spinifera]
MGFSETLRAAVAPGPDRKLPGAVVMAADASGREIIYAQAEGQTSVDPENAKPMSIDTTFWIASCTKLATSIAALQAVERGLLDLDADVSKILPEWKEPDILTGFSDAGEPQLKKATKKITLRQLLTHSSGMGYDFLSPLLAQWRQFQGEPSGPSGEPITKRLLLPLIYEPGEGWSYSIAIDWIGKMIERANGNIRLGDYLKRHIWEPLGMTSTGFRVPENDQIARNLCPTTERKPTGELVPSAPYNHPDPVDDLGGGGLYSSAADYIKILISLLKNDGTLLKPDSVKMMFEPQLADPKHLLEQTQHPIAGPIFRNGVESESWNSGLGGILTTVDVPGVCKKGTLSWGGLPNLFWWIDPAAGNCGIYASQLLPPGDPTSVALSVEFRKEIYSRCTS